MVSCTRVFYNFVGMTMSSTRSYFYHNFNILHTMNRRSINNIKQPPLSLLLKDIVQKLAKNEQLKILQMRIT